MRLQKILMDAADDNGSPSGYGTETAATTQTSETPQTQGDSGNSTQVDTQSTGTPDASAKTSDQSKQAATPESKEDVTGYNTETKVEEKPATETPTLELDVEGLPEETIKDIQEFAKSTNLTKEQAQAFVDKLKATEAAKAAAVENYKVEEAKVFQKWEAELKADPVFGGDNFAESVHSVNKLIREDLPGLKNLLTTSGKRLPPSVMKDLNSVARKLYGETELVQGEKAAKADTWKPTDFYSKT